MLPSTPDTNLDILHDGKDGRQGADAADVEAEVLVGDHDVSQTTSSRQAVTRVPYKDADERESPTRKNEAAVEDLPRCQRLRGSGDDNGTFSAKGAALEVKAATRRRDDGGLGPVRACTTSRAALGLRAGSRGASGESGPPRASRRRRRAPRGNHGRRDRRHHQSSLAQRKREAHKLYAFPWNLSKTQKNE